MHITRVSFTAVILLAGCAWSSSTTSTSVGTTTGASVQAAPLPQRPTRADVEFMSGMIGHHAQAVVMARLAEKNGAGSSIRALAERIEVSQVDEIRFMQSWLRRHNEPLPTIDLNVSPEHFHHVTSHAAMPGMLSAAQLDTLLKAQNEVFDRTFIRYMIQHHEGAIEMVRKLFSAQGAAQSSEVYRFASDVEADQRAEIRRMRLLEYPGKPQRR